MKNKPGILFVINDFNVGGAEVFILRLGIALQDHYQVFITDLSAHKSNKDFKQRFKDSGFNYISSRFTFPNRLEWLLWKLNAFFQIIGFKNFHQKVFNYKKKGYWKDILKKNKITIVNSHLIASDNFVLEEIYKFKQEVRFSWVITMHSSYNPLHYKDFKQKDIFFHKINKIMNSCDAIVGVAEENFKIFNEININKIPQKIYLGFEPLKNVDQDNNDELSSHHFNIIMIGRGIKEKGWGIAIDAFNAIKGNYSSVHLYLIGPLTDYMSDLKGKFEGDQIHFTGYQEDPTPYYRKAHLSILPSFGESLPYTVIESLGYNIPLIVSNRGEMPLMVQYSSDSAGLVLLDDAQGLPSTEDLEKGLRKLIEDKVYYTTLKENTTSAFHQFSMNHCMNQYLELFRKLNHE